jgi:hypothetical protein
MNRKKRGGKGVDVSILHSTPPPSLGLGRGGGIHRGSNFLCSVFFCDNMLFFEFEKRKKTVATYPSPGIDDFFLSSPSPGSQDWHFDERVFWLVKLYKKKCLHGEKTPRTNFAHTGHVKKLWWGVTWFCCRTILFRMCCFFYLQGTVSISVPIWTVKTYVVRVQHGADSASHERVSAWL